MSENPGFFPSPSDDSMHSAAEQRVAATPQGSVENGESSGNRWTFLTNHAHVIVLLKSEPSLVLREVARRVGITERAVQRIIQDLEGEGYLRREKVGRQNRYEVLLERPLRHPIEAHRSIGDILKVIVSG